MSDVVLSVRFDRELYSVIQKVVDNHKDDLGFKSYRSVSHFVRSSVIRELREKRYISKSSLVSFVEKLEKK